MTGGRIDPGTVVTWTSQSGGRTTTKTGTVVAFVPRGHSVPRGPRRDWMRHILAGDATVSRTGSRYSQNDRYLVRVEGPRSVILYAPTASQLEASE